ncbi:uncharacterized protein Tco025E_08225 [Trypanosoma conorhini]|uniref:Uncharacterized protein n=1 Tax=Trypanosoma conorhini TaxID=83891 RepID=A0A3R7K8H2_9TRYP|nr:uncharacterized protein Tco025E_08225 [Trypanosoma conorhini]RNF03474.1 hypothetical protein Tco025E_08225 [Trypanosoma conorhini]
MARRVRGGTGGKGPAAESRGGLDGALPPAAAAERSGPAPATTARLLPRAVVLQLGRADLNKRASNRARRQRRARAGRFSVLFEARGWGSRCAQPAALRSRAERPSTPCRLPCCGASGRGLGLAAGAAAPAEGKAAALRCVGFAGRPPFPPARGLLTSNGKKRGKEGVFFAMSA